ncbi:MAG: hypothetical protein Q7R93_01010 [bacterium]|nr:hypothetical protein [bacterium]
MIQNVLETIGVFLLGMSAIFVVDILFGHQLMVESPEIYYLHYDEVYCDSCVA